MLLVRSVEVDFLRHVFEQRHLPGLAFQDQLAVDKDLHFVVARRVQPRRRDAAPVKLLAEHGRWFSMTVVFVQPDPIRVGLFRANFFLSETGRGQRKTEAGQQQDCLAHVGAPDGIIAVGLTGELSSVLEPSYGAPVITFGRCVSCHSFGFTPTELSSW